MLPKLSIDDRANQLRVILLVDGNPDEQHTGCVKGCIDELVSLLAVLELVTPVVQLNHGGNAEGLGIGQYKVKFLLADLAAGGFVPLISIYVENGSHGYLDANVKAIADRWLQSSMQEAKFGWRDQSWLS